MNDDSWSRPDIDRIASGLTADAMAVTLSGLLGGMGSDTSASNVALSSASGATSRHIGTVAGLLFIALGFSPKIAALLSVMPTPVAGAILIYVISFMIMSGLQIIVAAKPGTHMTFVIGISLVFGISLDMLPQLYSHVAAWARPLFGSSLTLTSILAIVLNQLLRIGQKAAPTADRKPS